MASEDTVLHTRYRFKPDGTTEYVTLYFENGSNDVMIDTNISDVAVQGETNLTTVLQKLADVIASKAHMPVYDIAMSLAKKNPILKRTQLGVESDTGKMKMGDGRTPWLRLSYLVGGGSSKPVSDNEYITFNTTDTAIIRFTENDEEKSLPITSEERNAEAFDETPEDTTGMNSFVQIKTVTDDTTTHIVSRDDKTHLEKNVLIKDEQGNEIIDALDLSGVIGYDYEPWDTSEIGAFIKVTDTGVSNTRIRQ